MQRQLDACKRYLHNKSVLDTLEEGDLLEFPGSWYSHWGVYVGDNKVIHLTGVNSIGTGVDKSFSCASTFGSGNKKAEIRKECFWDVVGNSKAKKNNQMDGKKSPLPKKDIVNRAESMIGRVTYSVLWNNCEHFVHWCRNDWKKSTQAEKGLIATLLGFGAFIVVEVFREWFFGKGHFRNT